MDITHRTAVPDGELEVRTYPDTGIGPWADIVLDPEKRSYFSIMSVADADRLLRAVTQARAYLLDQAAGEGEAR